MSIEPHFQCDFCVGAGDAALPLVSGTPELSALSGFVTPQKQAFHDGSADGDL
jgi:hypothetical protein